MSAVNGIDSNLNLGVPQSYSRNVTGSAFASALNAAMASGGQTSLDQIFERASEKYNVPVNLLKAVAKVESGFNPKAVSRCGAQGIMQLMPGTAKELGVTDALDPEQNIMGGAKYLGKLLKRFNNNTAEALAAYNAGPGTVAKYGGVPSSAQGYVNKVLKYYNSYCTSGSDSVTSVGGSAMNSLGSAIGGLSSDQDNFSVSLQLLLYLQLIAMADNSSQAFDTSKSQTAE